VQLAVGCDYITDDHSAAALLSSSVRRGDAAAADGKGGSGSSLTRGVLVSVLGLQHSCEGARQVWLCRGQCLTTPVRVPACSPAQTPYFRLSENSWALRLSKGSLAFTYEM
jgi:hypothetical protein